MGISWATFVVEFRGLITQDFYLGGGPPLHQMTCSFENLGGFLPTCLSGPTGLSLSRSLAIHSRLCIFFGWADAGYRAPTTGGVSLHYCPPRPPLSKAVSVAPAYPAEPPVWL